MRARRKAAPLAPLPHLSFSLESRLLVGICLLALALRFWPLGGFSTEYDEGVYWQSLRALADGRAAAAAELARAGLGRLVSEWQRQGYVSIEKR